MIFVKQWFKEFFHLLKDADPGRPELERYKEEAGGI